MTDFPAPKPEDRFYLGEYGRKDGRPTLFRDNDGSLIIMERTPENPFGEATRRMSVPRFDHVPRAHMARADDAKQLAFASLIVGLLNVGFEAFGKESGTPAVLIPPLTTREAYHLREVATSYLLPGGPAWECMAEWPEPFPSDETALLGKKIIDAIPEETR